MALSLPPSPETQIAVRVHRMRVARGACWVIAIGLLGASTLALIDAAAWLTGWVRGLGLAIWLTSFGVLAWFFVVRPLNTSHSRNAARAAAKELPQNIQAAAAATVLIVGCSLAAVFVPNAAEHIRRVALPWYRPPAAGYRIIVTSHDPVVRCGDSITLSAYVEKLDPSVPRAENAVLVCRSGSGDELRLPMNRDEPGTFHATYSSVNASFDYRVEVEGIPSEWLSVTAIQSADPTLQSTIEISPPGYAAGAVQKQIIAGFSSFTALQYGKVVLNLKLSRPATKAFLEWRPEPSISNEVPIIPLTLTPDSMSAVAEFPLKQDGMLRLVTVVEEKGKTLARGNTIVARTTVDIPPRFERVRGVSHKTLFVRPGQSLTIDFIAWDDIAVGDAAIEYTIGADDSRPATLLFTLNGAGPQLVRGYLDFDLPGKLREGVTLKYRLRIADNRRISEPDLKPQEIVYPRTGWATVSVNPTALPIEQQEIAGQSEEINEGLERAQKEFDSLVGETKSLAVESAIRFELHHQVALEKIRARLKQLERNLLELAENVGLTLEQRAFASAIRQVVSQNVSRADENFAKALSDKNTNGNPALAAAVKDLSTASERFEQLRIRNSRISLARIDCFKIESLIAGQIALADRTRANPKIPPVDFVRDQKELSARLAAIVADSEYLKLVMVESRKHATQQFAKQISNLATELLELNSALNQVESQLRKEMLDTLAAEVSAVIHKTTDLMAKIELPARLLGVNTPKPEEFARIATLVSDGKTIEALTDLQKLSDALGAVAKPMEKAAIDRVNPKLACRQFANWQEDLRTRFRTATGEIDSNFKSLPLATKNAFLNEQKAIRLGLAALVLPVDRELAKIHEQAISNVLKVEECLAGSGSQADTAMREVINALNRMTESVLGIPERLAKSRSELEELLKEQELILNKVKPYVGKQDPALAKKLSPLAERQKLQLAAFSTLDLPGMEVRRGRILIALRLAVVDLESGILLDAFASQTWLNREFERLRLVLDRVPPLEEKVDTLIKRLEENTASLQVADSNLSKEQINNFVATLQDVHRQLTQAAIPEAAALRSAAIEAIKAAESRFHSAPKNEECLGGLVSAIGTIRKVNGLKMAVATLRKLSDRIVGAESDLERIQRLAWNRHLASINAIPLKGKDVNRAESDEAHRQLVREVDELLCTRVGTAAQSLKHRALDQYDKLKAIGEPDHAAGLQKNLADTLNELAGTMADVNELTLVFSRTTSAPVSTDVDTYLPSNQFVDALRTLARQQQLLRDRLNRLPQELHRRIDAIGNEPFFMEQKKRMDELIRRTALVSDSVQRAMPERDRDGSLNQHLKETRLSLVKTEQLLLEANEKLQKGQRSEAEKYRFEAFKILRKEADKLAKILPETTSPIDPKFSEIADPLLRAEAAIRLINQFIDDKPDSAPLHKAMRQFVDELKSVSLNRMRAVE